MDIEDWVILVSILVAIWVVLVPRPIRDAIQGNVGPLIAQSLDTLKPIVKEVAVFIEAAAFRAVVGRSRVNHSQVTAPEIMSNKGESPTPPSLETDASKEPDRPMMPVPTKEQMLDIFKVLRAAGISREAIGPALRAAGLPLNNNVWSDAAPTDVTPIVGRPTAATFRETGALAYKDPPQG